MKAFITKITTQQKNHERYNIFIDKGNGEEFGFSVDQDVLIKFQLKKGKVIDTLDLEEILFADDVKKAFNQAMQYLSFKMRSTKEIHDYLKQKEVAEPIIYEVIHKLIEYRYINDEEYALAYVRTQKNTTDKGPELIKKELALKGISKELIASSLQQYPMEEQVETLVKMCEKFFNKNQLLSELQKQAKLEQLCIRKGFSLSILEIALQEVKTDRDDSMEWDALVHHAQKVKRKFSHLKGFEYRQKMKQSMYRKGFSLELIDRFLDMEEAE